MPIGAAALDDIAGRAAHLFGAPLTGDGRPEEEIRQCGYIEGGSDVAVDRIAEEKANPQADELVTLPLFIHHSAMSGLLRSDTHKVASAIPAGSTS